MDPASAIGTVSAVLGIVSLIAKSVASLSDLQSRYGAADLKVSLLIGQLSTVKAALKQIAKLLEDGNGALRDPELIDDFSMSLKCVEDVVVILDDKISLVQRNAANELTIRSKVGFIWDEKTMDDYLSMLNNQIQALDLLLTALQWFVQNDSSSLSCFRLTRSKSYCFGANQPIAKPRVSPRLRSCQRRLVILVVAERCRINQHLPK